MGQRLKLASGPLDAHLIAGIGMIDQPPGRFKLQLYDALQLRLKLLGLGDPRATGPSFLNLRIDFGQEFDQLLGRQIVLQQKRRRRGCESGGRRRHGIRPAGSRSGDRVLC